MKTTQKTEYTLDDLSQWRRRVENSFTMAIFGKNSPKMTEAEYIAKLKEIDALIATKTDNPKLQRASPNMNTTPHTCPECGPVCNVSTDCQAAACPVCTRVFSVTTKHFIIRDDRKDQNRPWYVCAPPGYMRKMDGSVVRDGTNITNSGPEWSLERNHAFVFRSHRSAARVRTKTISGKIVGV